jgi:hypothetical protein
MKRKVFCEHCSYHRSIDPKCVKIVGFQITHAKPKDVRIGTAMKHYNSDNKCIYYKPSIITKVFRRSIKYE